MKITAVAVLPEKGLTVLDIRKEKELEIFNQTDDLNIIHLIVENKKFRTERQTGLQITCAFHLDWCLKGLIDNYGKEIFSDYIKDEPKNKNVI